MHITRLVVGMLQCNCYLLGDEESACAAVIDPGGEAERIIGRCEEAGLQPTHIIATHAHADHVGAIPLLKRRWSEAALCVGRGDEELLTDSARNLSAMLELGLPMPAADVLLEEGRRIAVGNGSLRVLETPGHTPGSISLLVEGSAPALVLCGDLLFRAGVGRTDLPGGSWETLRSSIREKIYTLPDETRILPGHGEPTTVAAEKATGPIS